MGSKITIFLLSVALVSLLVISGCKGKNESGSGSASAKVDMTTPPPLPEETGAGENEQPSAPPALPSDDKSQPQQQAPLGLP